MRRLPLSLFAIALLVCATAPARAQHQVTDPDFDTKVEQPMFTKRHPRLLVDQGHHNSHTTRARYDALAKLAIGDGFDVMTDENPFVLKDLQDTDVLLIANALGADDVHSPHISDPAFKPSECDALYQWISAGHSLLFVAENPPMCTSAMRLAKKLGVDFGCGYLVDTSIADAAYGASTLVFSSETGTLGDHAIIRGRNSAEQVRKVRTYTGQSLAGPPGSVALLRVTSRAQEMMLGTQGVSGSVPDSLKRPAGGRAQGIAFTLGKGRVVVLGETSMLSAGLATLPDGSKRKIGMNSEGFDNRQFALNTLRWLARGLEPSAAPAKAAAKPATKPVGAN